MLACQNTSCQKKYPIVYDIPILINEEASVFNIQDFLHYKETTFTLKESKFYSLAKKIIPSDKHTTKTLENSSKLLRNAWLSRTATFIGFVLGGIAGGLLATIGIFLPSFVFVAISNPLIPRVRNSAWITGLLDGVNVASLGLMAGVTLQLGRASLTDPLAILSARRP